jgi:hypothetical protein
MILDSEILLMDAKTKQPLVCLRIEDLENYCIVLFPYLFMHSFILCIYLIMNLFFHPFTHLIYLFQFICLLVFFFWCLAIWNARCTEEEAIQGCDYLSVCVWHPDAQWRVIVNYTYDPKAQTSREKHYCMLHACGSFFSFFLSFLVILWFFFFFFFFFFGDHVWIRLIEF